MIGQSQKVLYVPFAELLPCPYNRALDPGKVEDIKSAIRESSHIRPFVAVEVSTDDGSRFMITDGHHRHQALKEMLDAGELLPTLKAPFVLSGPEGVRTADRTMPAEVRENARDLKTLKPIVDRDAYHEHVFRVIWPAIDAAVYGPILAILREGARENSRASLLLALRSGRVFYKDGAFVGEFSSSISRYLRGLGATWDKAARGFRIPQTRIPADVRQALEDSAERYRDIERRIAEHVRKVSGQGIVSLDLDASFDVILNDLERQFSTTTAGTLHDAAGKLTVAPRLTEESMRRIAEAYTNNLDLYITSYTDDAVQRLRKTVEEAAIKGVRAEALARMIEGDRDVTRRKAKFLARQETSLMVSKFRQERYSEAGLTTYKWSTSGDERVREDHRLLDGKAFRFDQPPVTDRATMARNNPGEDFNCRCLALPVVPRRLA